MFTLKVDITIFGKVKLDYKPNIKNCRLYEFGMTQFRDTCTEYYHVVWKADDYIKSSGKWLVDNGFIEKEVHRTVDAFGNIAHVFSTYESFHSKTDDAPFMRGINSIQLLNDGKRWWIVNIYWTQETEENPIPKKYLK